MADSGTGTRRSRPFRTPDDCLPLRLDRPDSGGEGQRAPDVRKQLPGEWHPNGRGYVLVDPYTAQVVPAIDARAQGTATRLMHAVHPVHAAKVGGLPMVLVAAFAAAALTWLAAGGPWGVRRLPLTGTEGGPP